MAGYRRMHEPGECGVLCGRPECMHSWRNEGCTCSSTGVVERLWPACSRRLGVSMHALPYWSCRATSM